MSSKVAGLIVWKFWDPHFKISKSLTISIWLSPSITKILDFILLGMCIIHVLNLQHSRAKTLLSAYFTQFILNQGSCYAFLELSLVCDLLLLDSLPYSDFHTHGLTWDSNHNTLTIAFLTSRDGVPLHIQPWFSSSDREGLHCKAIFEALSVVCSYCGSLIAPFETLHGEATPNAKNSTKIPMIDG